eukprot:10403580-Karenia_brevis.AAC.1
MTRTEQECEEELTRQETQAQKWDQTTQGRQGQTNQERRRFKKGMLEGITFEDVAEHYPMLYFARVYRFEQDWEDHDEEEIDRWVDW